MIYGDPTMLGVKARAILLIAMLAGAVGCERGKASTLADAAAGGAGGDIKVSLTHPYDLRKDDFELVFAVPSSVGAVSVCEVRLDATCAVTGPGVFGTKLVYASGDRKFFKANATALLENGLMLKLVALNASGSQVDARMVAVSGTGQLGKVVAAPTSTATPAATTAPSSGTDEDEGYDPNDFEDDGSGFGYDPT
jgi:hypothetical protein